MSFAENIQKLRKKNGLSQENLAEVIGVSRQAVSKWESGQSYPDTDKLIALSDYFKVTVDEILKGNNPAHVQDVPIRENHEFQQECYPWRYRWHYEYKSKRTLFNMPLVHINIGRGIYTAKGIIAIGTIARGFFALGSIAFGGIAFGALSFGIASFGALALALLFSVGAISIGAIAIGAVAIGIIATGALAIGAFSLGACSIAKYIAVGSYANGHIAIGDTVKGAKTIIVNHHNFNSIKAEQVIKLINHEYPKLWKPIVDWLTFIFN
ncbi:helix-turn-helix domain-containing protein [Clostridium oryzae]|nr:helix-turn-helix transcriptional regulator [Clostridium oryzae]